MSKPSKPVSNYYERALSKVLLTGHRPAYPTGAYCLFSAHRRRQLLQSNPKLLQKQAFEVIQKEWKTSHLREDFQEIARRDYKDYKRLCDLWTAMQAVGYQGSKLQEAQQITLGCGKEGNLEPSRGANSFVLPRAQIRESRSNWPSQENNEEVRLFPSKMLTPAPACSTSGSSQQDDKPTHTKEEKASESSDGDPDDHDCSSRSIWTSSDELEEQELINHHYKTEVDPQQISVSGRSAPFSSGMITNEGNQAQARRPLRIAKSSASYAYRPNEDHIPVSKDDRPAARSGHEASTLTGPSTSQFNLREKCSTDEKLGDSKPNSGEDPLGESGASGQ